MDSILEENGNANNVAAIAAGGSSASDVNSSSGPSSQQQQQQQQQQRACAKVSNLSAATALAPPSSATSSVLNTTGNVVQYLPNTHSIQVQSVIQAANQSSVIQTAAANAPALTMSKGGVLVVSKANATVIHTTQSNAVQHLDTNSDDSFTDEDSPRRRSQLTRRPSYHKIFNDISGPDISDSTVIAEDQTRKREIRLQKNREAARECRRKKKEYIKCLENRVAVLENQNKALIEELKSLKELYCQTRND